MQELRTISNQQLVQNIKSLAAEERRLTLAVISHLEEIDRRRLHLEQGYPSLFEWCVSELKYSAGAAQRRIDAMRLSREIPEIKTAVQDGRINLTIVSQAQKFFRHEKKSQGRLYSTAEKKDLLRQMEGLSSKQCERELVALSPGFAPTEKTRPFSETRTQITFVADQKLMQDLERIKNLWAHHGTNLTYSELFKKMAELTLNKIDPMKKTNPGTQNHKPTAAAAVNRHIPSPIRRQVWQRDQGNCTYIDPKSQRRCGSTHALQMDHVHPYAQGGSNQAANLRLRCRAHNLWHAEQTYGAQKIQTEIERKAS